MIQSRSIHCPAKIKSVIIDYVEDHHIRWYIKIQLEQFYVHPEPKCLLLTRCDEIKTVLHKVDSEVSPSPDYF